MIYITDELNLKQYMFKYILYQELQFCLLFLWVCTSAYRFKGGTQAEGVYTWGTEEDVSA